MGPRRPRRRGRPSWSPGPATLQLAGAGGGHAGAGWARSGRCRPSCPATCLRAGTGSRAGPAPPPWWSRPGAAICRPSWTAAGAPGAGRPSSTPSARGPAGASATCATWPGCWPPARPWAPGSPCSTPCTPPSRGSRALQPVQPGVPQPAVPPGRGRARAGRSRPRGAGTGRGAGRRRPRPARPGPHRPAGRLPAQGRGPAPGPRRPRPGPAAGTGYYTAATGNWSARHLLRPPARPRQRLARLAGQLPPPRPARGPPSAPSTARRSTTTPGSSGCSTSSWRPPAGLQAAGVVNDLAIGFAPTASTPGRSRTSWPPACRSAPRPTPWGRTARTGACRRSCPTGWPPAATARSPRPSRPAWPMPPACASTM